jgi:hypothetical protein
MANVSQPPETAGDHRGDTRASTVGILPDSIAAGLFGVVTVGILLLGTTLGFGLLHLLALCLSGLVAALGIRIGSSNDSARIVVGVSLLWVGALGVTGTTALLAAQPVEGLVAASAFAPLAVAIAALLGPVGIVGSTVMLYGHGVGRLVLRRYFFGTLVLVGIAVLMLIAFAVGDSGLGFVTGLVPSLGSGSAETGDVLPRAILGLLIYTILRYVTYRASEAFPAAVFVSPAEFEQVAAARTRIEGLYQTAKYALVAYVGLLVALIVLSIAGQDSLAGFIRLGLHLLALPALLTLASLTIVLLAFLLGVLRVLRSAKGLTEGAMAEILVPPVAVFLLSGLVVLLAGDVATTIVEEQLSGVASPGKPIYGLLTVEPTVSLLLLTALALVSTAIILSIPTVLAGKTPGDASLAGIAASVLGLTILLILVILADAHVAIILTGVVIAAVVWEFGEYAMVAAGELWDRSGSEGFPNGFTRLASIHVVSTLVVVIAGLGVAGIALAMAGGSAIPVAPAVFIVISSGIAIAALTYLLTG